MAHLRPHRARIHGKWDSDGANQRRSRLHEARFGIVEIAASRISREGALAAKATLTASRISAPSHAEIDRQSVSHRTRACAEKTMRAFPPSPQQLPWDAGTREKPAPGSA